jgi:hypothetical protein
MPHLPRIKEIIPRELRRWRWNETQAPDVSHHLRPVRQGNSGAVPAQGRSASLLQRLLQQDETGRRSVDTDRNVERGWIPIQPLSVSPVSPNAARPAGSLQLGHLRVVDDHNSKRTDYASPWSTFSFSVSHCSVVRTQRFPSSPISTWLSFIFTTGQHEPELQSVTSFI